MPNGPARIVAWIHLRNCAVLIGPRSSALQIDRSWAASGVGKETGFTFVEVGAAAEESWKYATIKDYKAIAIEVDTADAEPGGWYSEGLWKN